MSRPKSRRVELSDEDREFLTGITRTGSHPAKAYAERGGDAVDTVTRKKRLTPPVPAKTTGEVEARLVALACTKPPEGHATWSLRLLEKHVLLTEGLPPLDHSTIGRVLKKRNFSLT